MARESLLQWFLFNSQDWRHQAGYEGARLGWRTSFSLTRLWRVLDHRFDGVPGLWCGGCLPHFVCDKIFLSLVLSFYVYPL